MSNHAGFWIRLGGVILDGIMIGAVIFAVIFIFGLDTANPFVQFGESIITILYYLLVPVLWYGYTLGKRVVGVRIVKTNGANVTIGTMLLRHIVGGLVYSITLGIGVIVSAFMVGLREDKRAIHDFIAGTYVTHNQP
ncbi:putative RDD family membrane protein YckC [Geomicrobium halophilum]|uniref:Putative RDD family membrane protein YckC n=1 Tax=Geomicrobium halophilum TaxID=549000 RepID=A0A841Q0Z9_9BACL|nr:putative RDD family membrane protein YckC [Geomicrobium halophilum]